MKKIIITMLMAALPLTAQAKILGVVTNTGEHVVSDDFDGCVRTGWEADKDACHHKSCEIHKIAMVFFDFNRAHLREEAVRTVRKVYNELREKGHNAVLHVVGHTDTVGTAEYNHKLSLKRAESVRNELVHLGIPTKDIRVSGKGFSQLLVQTGPNVKEVENRRVEIFYSIED